MEHTLLHQQCFYASWRVLQTSALISPRSCARSPSPPATSTRSIISGSPRSIRRSRSATNASPKSSRWGTRSPPCAPASWSASRSRSHAATARPASAGGPATAGSVEFMSTYGFGPAVERWGGFLSDLVRVPYADHMLVPVPQGLEPAQVASASDNISDAWRAVGPPLAPSPARRCSSSAAPSSGSIGLYAVAIAVALGAEAVTYVDADPDRERSPSQLGAATLDQTPKRLGRYPITVDASADPDGLALALRSTAADGTCTSTAIYFGRPADAAAARDVHQMHHLHNRPRTRPRAIPHVLQLARQGALHPEQSPPTPSPGPTQPTRYSSPAEPSSSSSDENASQRPIGSGSRSAVTGLGAREPAEQVENNI